MSEVRRIPLAAIVVDLAIQQRARGTSEDTVNEYAEAMRNGDKFPAVIVFSDDDRTFHLADGFHRIDAHQLAHCDVLEIECEVHHGNREDALVFGCSANSGLRRDPSDQRKAVASLLEVRPEWADRAIARHCKVSPTLVANVRKEHLQTTFIDAAQDEARAEGTPAANERQKIEATAVAPRQRIVVRSGKQYPMKTGNIGAGRTKPSRSKAKPRTASRRKKPEPFLTAFAWTMATEPERINFVNGVGAAEIVDALKAIEPTLDLLNMVWKATGLRERQAFAKARLEEINALAKAPGPTLAGEPSANRTPADTHHAGV